MDESKRKPMVAWYDPWQLLRTAQLVVVSTIFGRNADFRTIEAISNRDDKDPFVDLSTDEKCAPRDKLWIDYVADAGDGWNPTHAIAHYVAEPSLKIRVRGKEESLPRAEVLIFGGDEVYPTASREEYEQRLIAPYESALKRTEGSAHPKVFAIPGNHDWYDSLVSFTGLFCAKEWMAGWEAPQKRSYFGLKLPHHWWLIGLDMQLESDVDQDQMEFFIRIAGKFEKEDRVILCNAEPYWIYNQWYQNIDPGFAAKYEHYVGFLDKYFKDRVRVMLAGDLHHYRRHESTAATKSTIAQKITAGGGGAFLHPTHAPDASKLDDGYEHRASFPEARVSRVLSLDNLMFWKRNCTFGFLPAILYFVLAWSINPHIGGYGLSEIGCAVITATAKVIEYPGSAFWPIAILAGFWLFTDTHSANYRRIASPLHGMANLAAAFALFWFADYLFLAICGTEPGGSEISRFWYGLGHVVYLIVPIGGYFAGSFIMGLYLLISLNTFGRHFNEAFSSLAIEDWKSFLRIRVDENGLEIYPIGIKRVPRKWKDREMLEGTKEHWTKVEPDDPEATPPELIEDPIVVKLTVAPPAQGALNP